MKIKIPLCLLLFCSLLPSHLQAQAQIGGGICTNATLNGTYYYVTGGTLRSGNTVYPYSELGKLVADGQGNVVSGRSQASVGGSLTSYTLGGKYSVQANCSGTLTLTVNSQASSPVTFQIVDGGEGAVIAYSQQSEVVSGRAYRSDGAGQCGNASFSAGYAYLLTGVAYISGSGYYYSQSGTVVADGNGNLSGVATVNTNGTTVAENLTGSYSLASDCSGIARVISSSGTANYTIAAVQNGQGIVFLETDTNTTVAGLGQPQFTAPQQSIVNGGSFAPESLSPGSIFSVFGIGLSQQTASAQTLPLPRALDSTQVFVDGLVAPLFYVSPGQINAQMPLEVPTGVPVSVIVGIGSQNGNTTTVTLAPGAPGIFIYGSNQAVVQNQDGTLNSDAAPAHAGDVLVGYLTGGGPVNAAGPLATGAPSPSGQSPVASGYSVTVGGQQAGVLYLGLTPSLVGVYQVNFTLPALPPGRYPLAIVVNGIASNGPTISVGQ